MTIIESTEGVAVGAEQIIGIAQEVWTSFLDMEIAPHPLGADAPALDGPTLTGCVHVTGEWQGSVFLQCSAELSVAAAEAMFAAEPGSLSAEEISDALGELTNMIGGNIKSLLPAPSTLSVPSVAEGVSYTVRVPGAHLVDSVALVCAAGLLTISIWKV
jgi:chemotaxis protein CheX